MKNKIDKQFPLYIAIWIVYLLQGLLYKEGSLFSQMLGLVILVLSIQHYMKVMKTKNKPEIFRGLTLMLTLYTIYALFFIVSYGFSLKTTDAELSIVNYLKNYYLSILPIFSGYYFTQKGLVDLKLLKKWVPVFLIVGVLVYYREATDRMASLLEEGIDSDEITNNSGYFILGILPYAMAFYKKPIIQYIIMVFCSILILMSMKRGAVLVAIMVVSYIVIKEFKKMSSRNKTAVFFGAIFAFAVLFYYVRNILMSNDFFVLRIESTLEGQSSGRDTLYSVFWNHILHGMSLFELLVGEGAMATVRIAGKFAHNDWFETMICHGIIGISAFIYYWRSFFSSTRNRRLNPISRIVLSSYFIMYLLMTFFSMSIGSMVVFAGIMIGFSTANGFDEFNRDNLSKV